MSKRDASSELNHTNWDKEEEPEEAGTFAVASREELDKRVIKKAKRRPEHSEANAQSGVFSGFKGFDMMKAQSASSGFNWPKSDNSSLNGTLSKGFSFSPKTSMSFSSSINTSTTLTASQASSVMSSLPSVFSSSVAPGPSFSTTLTDKKSSPVTTASLPTTSSTLFSSTPVSVASSVANSSSSPKTVKQTQSASDIDLNSLPRDTEFYRKLKALNECIISWISKHVEENPYCILTPVFADYEKYYKEFDKAYPICNPPSPVNSKEPAKDAPTSVSSNLAPSFGSSPLSIKQQPQSQGSDKPEDAKEKTVKDSSSFSFFNSVDKGGQSTTKSPFTMAKISFAASKMPTTLKSGFTFATATTAPLNNNEDNEEATEEYVPPKPEVQTVVEEGAFYSQRCKLFYKKADKYVERGIGMLHLKSLNDKTQLLVRADTVLGNILLNIILNESITTQLTGNNNVLLVCVPNPPIDPKETNPEPTPMLIRVKSKEEAQKLLEIVDKHKS